MSTTREPDPVNSRRPERLFVSATFITMLGNNIQLIATSLLVYRTAGTALSVGWVFILTAIPQVAFSAPFGRIADRVDRRKLCLLADTGSAMTAVALPVSILLGAKASVAGYIVCFVLALFASVFMPASNALFKERLPRERLSHFNANYEIAYECGALLSGALGGFIAQLVGLMPLFYFNSATFIGSIACVLAVGRRRARVPGVAAEPEPGAAGPTAPSRSDGRRPILRLGLLFATSTVLITVANTLLLVAVVKRFHQGAALLGVVDALAGIGILAAAVLYKRINRRADYRYLIMIGFVACAVLTALQPIAVWTLLVGILLGGMAFGMGRLPARTELMRAVDHERAGRTFGLANAFGLAASIAATVVVATVVGRHGVVPGFLTLALIGGVPAALITVSMIVGRTLTPALERVRAN